jgi:hypothetical protein
MTRLLTKFVLGISLATGLVAAASKASAQAPTAMTVTVPFAFTADSYAFDAGRYTVSASQSLLTLTNLDTNKTSTVIIRSNLVDRNDGPTRLTFQRRYGQTYLAQVWTSGRSSHSELISHPKARPEIASLTLPDATFEVATK